MSRFTTLCFWLVCLVTTLPAHAETQKLSGHQKTNLVFEQMGERYRIDPNLLRAVAYRESTWHPWTINVNRESFYPRSKAEAIELLHKLDAHRWLLTFRDSSGKKTREFYKSEAAANAALRAKRGYTSAKIRWVNVKLTDVGIMQINWYWHGEKVPSLGRLFDLDYNIAYGASYLSRLVHQHGVFEGLARYNAGTDWSNGVGYAKSVMKAYKRYQGSNLYASR